jgi:hypothetical protein
MAAKGNIQNIAWSAKILLNSFNMATGMLLRGEFATGRRIKIMPVAAAYIHLHYLVFPQHAETG